MDLDPDPGLLIIDEFVKKLYKFYNWKNLVFDQKLQFIYPYASMKDVQATGEAFRPQKKASTLENLKFLHFYFIFVGPAD